MLDVPATLSQNQVVIDLARRQRRPGGDWGPLKPWWHSPDSAQAKYDPDGLFFVHHGVGSETWSSDGFMRLA